MDHERWLEICVLTSSEDTENSSVLLLLLPSQRHTFRYDKNSCKEPGQARILTMKKSDLEVLKVLNYACNALL